MDDTDFADLGRAQPAGLPANASHAPRVGGRDDAGLETWITRARAVDVKVILETDWLLLRVCVEDDAEAFFKLNTGH
jgi:hypothetical protein